MAKALELQPVAQLTEFYKVEGLKTVNECLVLNQLLYWGKVNGFNEFCKTDQELSEETKVSTHCIERIKRKFKTFPFLTVQRKCMPAKTYYKIDPQKLSNATNSEYIKNLIASASKTK